MNRKTFEQQMPILLATWPDRRTSPDMLAAYWLALGHLDDAVFAEAIARCLRECTFFPVPAEILDRARTVLASAGALPPEPEAAWEDVLTAIRRQTGPTWGIPEIAQAVRAVGGLETIGHANTDTRLPHIRREFLARYGELRDRAIRQPDVLAQALPDDRPALTGGDR